MLPPKLNNFLNRNASDILRENGLKSNRGHLSFYLSCCWSSSQKMRLRNICLQESLSESHQSIFTYCHMITHIIRDRSKVPCQCHLLSKGFHVDEGKSRMHSHLCFPTPTIPSSSNRQSRI